MPIIVVGSSKGGSGKSTLCTNLTAMHLAQGNKCLLIDTDPQRSSSNWAELRSGNEHKPEVIPIEKHGADIQRAAPEMATHYDMVFVDVPGNASPALRASLVIADLLIYPIRPSNFDAWVLDQDFREMIASARMFNPELRVMVVMNGLNPSPGPRSRETQNLRSYLADYSHFYLSPHYLCHRSAFNVAVQEGRAVVELEGKEPSLERARFEISDVYRDALRCLGGERDEAMTIKEEQT